MGDGLEYDPEAVAAYSAIIAEAAGQVAQIQEKMADTNAKAADFGNSWADDQGARYDKYMAAIAADLGNLSTHLTEISGQLNQGSELIIMTETSGLRNIKEIDAQLGGEK